jgi:hypothetical protein
MEPAAGLPAAALGISMLKARVDRVAAKAIMLGTSRSHFAPTIAYGRLGVVKKP